MTAPVPSGRHRLRALFLATLTLGFAMPAEAHLVNTGLGPFYDGVSHFVLTPEDLIPALALALLAGLGGARAGRLTLFVLPAVWFAAGVLGLVSPTNSGGEATTTISFLLLGALVAADLPLGAFPVAGLAVVLGAVHGYLNGSMAAARLGSVGLAGIVSALFVTVALAAGLVVSIRAVWARVAVRVAGSWIAATGLLLLGWSLRAR